MAGSINSNSFMGVYSALARACATYNTTPQSGGQLFSPQPAAPFTSTQAPSFAMNPAMTQMLLMWFVMLLNMFMGTQGQTGTFSSAQSSASIPSQVSPQRGDAAQSAAQPVPAGPFNLQQSAILAPVNPFVMPQNSNINPNTNAGQFTNWIAPDGRRMGDHPDLNLNIRGMARVDAEQTLVGINGETDRRAPKLGGLLRRTPRITGTYSVFDWNWQTGTRGGLTSRQEAPVTMVGFQTQPGEAIYVPPSGYRTDQQGHEAKVVYVDEDSIAINYTGRGDVVDGYTVHVEGVRPRADLKPGSDVRGNEPLGTATGTETKVAVRDKGSFMDPRSAKDWW